MRHYEGEIVPGPYKKFVTVRDFTISLGNSIDYRDIVPVYLKNILDRRPVL